MYIILLLILLLLIIYCVWSYHNNCPTSHFTSYRPSMHEHPMPLTTSMIWSIDIPSHNKNFNHECCNLIVTPPP